MFSRVYYKLDDVAQRFIIRRAIRRLQKDYGGPCLTKDFDDFPGEIGRELNSPDRCLRCAAAEVVEWLQGQLP